MIREQQTRWIAAPNAQKAGEMAVKRGKDLALTYDAGLQMLEKARQRGAWSWKIFEIRFVIEVDEAKP